MSEIDESPTTQHNAQVTRRVVLRSVTVGGVTLPLLAACGGGDSSGSSSGSSAGSSSGSSSGGSAPSGSGGVATADVPEGGGIVLAEQKVVVTQPTKGDFKAFTAICTHQGCTVNSVQDGEIVCGCHGSQFSIKDGSNVEGPNGSAAGPVAPLQSKKVSVEGGQISVS